VSVRRLERGARVSGAQWGGVEGLSNARVRVGVEPRRVSAKYGAKGVFVVLEGNGGSRTPNWLIKNAD